MKDRERERVCVCVFMDDSMELWYNVYLFNGKARDEMNHFRQITHLMRPHPSMKVALLFVC